MNNNIQLKKQNINEVVNKNKIKQSSLCCIYCGKSYKYKMTLDKHIILCEVTNKLKSKTNDEDDSVVPSQKQMYQIIIDLVLKCNRLETKVDYLSKCINRKINKINVIDYLNNTNKPQLLFDNISEIINVEQSDIEFLFQNSFKETLNNILNRTLYEKNKNTEMSEPIPLVSFVEKANIIYIYTTNATQNNNVVTNSSWIIAPR